MNGLEETYRSQVEFRAVNAGLPEGLQPFQAYALPGHPGYVLLNPAGEVLWRGFGELSSESITAQLDDFLEP